MTGSENVQPGRSLLAVAIEREDWDLAALCLLVGLVRAAEKLPPETLDELLMLLEDKSRGRR